mgnify:CR=1 FL=1
MMRIDDLTPSLEGELKGVAVVGRIPRLNPAKVVGPNEVVLP